MVTYIHANQSKRCKFIIYQKPEAVNKELANLNNLTFVPILFNGVTALSQLEMNLKDAHDIAFILLFPRLVHSLFACDVDFDAFLKAFYECYGHNFDHLMNDLQTLKQKHFPGIVLAVLVDEISKVNNPLKNQEL